MKKNRSTIFYIIAILFYVASIITFCTGNRSSTGTVWLCLGSTFLCLGTSMSRKKPGDSSETE